MVDRARYLKAICTALKRSLVVALLWPRQYGKTTLARQILSADSVNYFDLEDPAVAAVLEQPMTALKASAVHRGGLEADLADLRAPGRL